jgi:dTDP-4-dehydrorhamnose reductase
VRQVNAQHIIARTAWVYSPVGANFVKTMLRLASHRDSLRVVDDQMGNPTYAPHLAQALLEIARKVRHAPRDDQWGTYHLVGRGDVSWCGFAKEVFRVSAELGGPSASVTAITTAEYPTPAARPKNSRLDCSKAEQTFGVALPDWREGVRECVMRLLGKG